MENATLKRELRAAFRATCEDMRTLTLTNYRVSAEYRALAARSRKTIKASQKTLRRLQDQTRAGREG